MDKNTVFREMAQYRAIIAEAQSEYDRLEAEVKAYMEEHGDEVLQGDEHKATYTSYIEKRFDSASFRKDHADMYESYRKPQTKHRFTFA